MDYYFAMLLLFLLPMLLWNDSYGGSATQECGVLLNNTLKSPGYPNSYPNYMDCVYKVPIPDGMAMNISFHYFEVEDHPSCKFDYLKISSNHTFRVFCGNETGQTVLIAGDDVRVTFHSDSHVQERGFLLFFTAVPVGKRNPATDVLLNCVSTAVDL
ncbi:CUB and peptidase domain-containing protein 1-like [Oculina patagonica]